jgi:hypothetical protein
MLHKFITLHWNFHLYCNIEGKYKIAASRCPLAHFCLLKKSALFFLEGRAEVDKPISFSSILGPLKCLFALVLPLLVASWHTALLNFSYLAHPVFCFLTSVKLGFRENSINMGQKIWHKTYFILVLDLSSFSTH